MASPGDVFSWVESFTNLERGNLPFDKRTYRLDRMRRLLGMFDDPDRELVSVHVAGTKGKGSTAALIASVLQAAGHRTGLYTSPHVNSPYERIALTASQLKPNHRFRPSLAKTLQLAVTFVTRIAPTVGLTVRRIEPFRSMRVSPQQGGQHGLAESLLVLQRP